MIAIWRKTDKIMNLNELRDKAYRIAYDHGFHDKELSNEHCLMLVITELSEAVEADRKDKYADIGMFKEWQSNPLPISEELRISRFKHKTYKGYIVSRFVYSSDWNDGHAHGTILYEYELKGNIYDNPELIKEE